jgi:hypothetical protein
VRTKEELNAYQRKWYAGLSHERKEKERSDARDRCEKILAAGFGYTVAEWRAIKASQPECAVCHRILSDTVNRGRLKQRNTRHADHDHATGKFREFLCWYCNLVLGYAEDSIEVLEGALAYLKKHQI